MSKLVISILFYFIMQPVKVEAGGCENISFSSQEHKEKDFEIDRVCQKYLESLDEEELDKEIRRIFVLYKGRIRESTWPWFLVTRYLCDLGDQDNCTHFENSKKKFDLIKGKFKQDPKLLIIDPLKPATYTKGEMHNSLNAMFSQCKNIPTYSAIVSPEALSLFRKITHSCFPDGDLGLFLYFNDSDGKSVMNMHYYINYQNRIFIDFLNRHFSNYISWLTEGSYDYNFLPLKLRLHLPNLLDAIVESRRTQRSISIPSKMTLVKDQIVKKVADYPELLSLLKEETIVELKLLEELAEKNPKDLNRISIENASGRIPHERRKFLIDRIANLNKIATKNGSKYASGDQMVRCIISNNSSQSNNEGQRIELFPSKINLKDCISIVETIAKAGVRFELNNVHVGCSSENQKKGKVENLTIVHESSDNFYSTDGMNCSLSTKASISETKKCVSFVSRYGGWDHTATSEEFDDYGSEVTLSDCKKKSLERYKDRTCSYTINKFESKFPLKKINTFSIEGPKLREVDHFECTNNFYEKVTYSSFERERELIESALNGVAFEKEDCFYNEKSSQFLKCKTSKKDNIVYHLNKVGHEGLEHDFEISGLCKDSPLSFIEVNRTDLMPILGKQLKVFMAEVKDSKNNLERRTIFSNDLIQTITVSRCSMKITQYTRVKDEVSKSLMAYFKKYESQKKTITNPISTPLRQDSKTNCRFSQDLYRDKNLDIPFYTHNLGVKFEFQLPNEKDCLALYNKLDIDSLCLNTNLWESSISSQSKGHLRFDDKVIGNFLCPQSLEPQAFDDSTKIFLKSNKQISCHENFYSYACKNNSNQESTLWFNYNHFQDEKIDSMTISFKDFMSFEKVIENISFWLKISPVFKVDIKIIKKIFDEVSTSKQLKSIVKVKGHTIVLNWKSIKFQKIPALFSIKIFKTNES